MIHNPVYETVTLLAPFEQGPLVHTFLRDTFFGSREYPPTSNIEFDFRRGRRKMAPFVAPLVGGKIMEREGFETRFFKAPRLAPVRGLRTPDLEARLPGETIYGGRTPADRAAELMAEDSIYLDEAISRREEWMCREVLINGMLTVQADVNYEVVINYLESSKGPIDNHEQVAVKWDDPASDPLADLERSRLSTIRESGISPNVALFGTDAAAAFIHNESVQTLLDNRRFMLGTIEPAIKDDAVVLFGTVPGLQLYTYSEYFEDDAGELFPMLPPELVMLASTNVPNKIVYGAYTQLEDAKAKRYQTYQTSRIPFVYGDEENGHLFYRLTSCPLPMPADVLGFRIVEALPPSTGTMSIGGKKSDRDLTKPYFKPLKPEGDEEVAGEEGNSLSDKTVDELKEIADEEGVDLTGVSRKDDIMRAIRKERKGR